ncbi:hypothetical protein NM688_g1807 [Phlebia brevispora]|uniref:Uncharacterized protein n=1 Tax=Phlebia brevispora TaxID=194682 RepID=A0ACC1TB35_9APHY|nr:hypothetical protein NM688_g1807 [Phlebia brevispora]
MGDMAEVVDIAQFMRDAAQNVTSLELDISSCRSILIDLEPEIMQDGIDWFRDLKLAEDVPILSFRLSMCSDPLSIFWPMIISATSALPVTVRDIDVVATDIMPNGFNDLVRLSTWQQFADSLRHLKNLQSLKLTFAGMDDFRLADHARASFFEKVNAALRQREELFSNSNSKLAAALPCERGSRAGVDQHYVELPASDKPMWPNTLPLITEEQMYIRHTPRLGSQRRALHDDLRRLRPVLVRTADARHLCIPANPCGAAEAPSWASRTACTREYPSVPALKAYPKFHEWAQKYGEIFYLRLGPQNVIVLNTAEAADELLTNRSKDYSGRASPHVASELMSAGQRMVFMSYDKEWRVARRNIQTAIGPTASAFKHLRRLLDFESITVLNDLLHYEEIDRSRYESLRANSSIIVPEDHWFAIFRRYTTSNVMTMTYGKRAHQIRNNPWLHKIYDVVTEFVRVSQPGNYIADAFPIIRKLPDFLAPWRKEGKWLHEWEMELWGGLLAEQQAMHKSGVHRDCFVSSYLRQRSEAGLEESPGRGITDGGWMKDELLAYTAATILEAGSDTTATALQAFVLFMLRTPRVLKKAKEEIDTVIGPDRLPTSDDEARLPYLVACIKETLRRHPVIVMDEGIPHQAEKDDEYKGYFIPKGSTVISNIWAIHMDPEKYPDPTSFYPERYYKPGEPTPWGTGPGTGRDHYAFGFGRRFCQGPHIAELSMFVLCARVLWAFDFASPPGCPLPDINDELNTWSDGFISAAKVFPVVWKPRSKAKEDFIRRKYEEIQGEWTMEGFAEDCR